MGVTWDLLRNCEGIELFHILIYEEKRHYSIGILHKCGEFFVTLHSQIRDVRQPLGLTCTICFVRGALHVAIANQRRAQAFRADMHYLLRANLKVCHSQIRKNVTNIISIAALRSVEYSGE